MKAVTVENFSKWLLGILHTIVAGRGVDRTSWIVPPPFCCVREIGNDRYLLGNKVTGMAKKSHPA